MNRLGVAAFVLVGVGVSVGAALVASPFATVGVSVGRDIGVAVLAGMPVGSVVGVLTGSVGMLVAADGAVADGALHAVSTKKSARNSIARNNKSAFEGELNLGRMDIQQLSVDFRHSGRGRGECTFRGSIAIGTPRVKLRTFDTRICCVVQ